ncbi:MAG: hypothetical protein K8J08_22850 [Thermoanaerobaculia bacterium]|nr:hypothetical protein [Thermoanaerobaculia bacterium]
MKRKTLTFLFFGVAALVVAVTATLITPSASAGCTACGGPTLTVAGHGSGSSCAEALDEAQSDATQKSFAGAPACVPCQTSSGPQSCSTPSCYPGACPPNSFHATYTLNYKCRSCEFERPDPSM